MKPRHKYLCIIDDIKSRAGAFWNDFLASEDGFIVSFPMNFFGRSISAVSSIQQIGITLTSTSNIATISAVNPSLTIIIPQGGFANSSGYAAWQECMVSFSVTNSTTITATSGFTSTYVDTVVVKAVVVQFAASAVNSIQSGSISVINASSNTATISNIGSNAFVIFTGCTVTNSNGYYSTDIGRVVLTNSTTVRAFVGGDLNAQMSVGYIVADLKSSVVTSVQALTHTMVFGTLTSTDTISSVITGNCLIIYGGVTSTGADGRSDEVLTRIDLTNSTTVTLTRQADTKGYTVNTSYTIVQFAPALLNGSVQRGDITLTSSTSGTSTISRVNAAKSFVNYASLSTNSGLSDATVSRTFMSLTLTNATTITANIYAAASPTISFEVIQFK